MSSATRAASPKLCGHERAPRGAPFRHRQIHKRARPRTRAPAPDVFETPATRRRATRRSRSRRRFRFFFGEDPPSFVVETWSTSLDGLMLRGFWSPTPRTVFFPNALEKTSSARVGAHLRRDGLLAQAVPHRLRAEQLLHRAPELLLALRGERAARERRERVVRIRVGRFRAALVPFRTKRSVASASARAVGGRRDHLRARARDDVDAPSSWESSDAPRRSAAFARVDAAFIAGSRHSEEALAGLPRAARTPPAALRANAVRLGARGRLAGWRLAGRHVVRGGARGERTARREPRAARRHDPRRDAAPRDARRLARRPFRTRARDPTRV